MISITTQFKKYLSEMNTLFKFYCQSKHWNLNRVLAMLSRHE